MIKKISLALSEEDWAEIYYALDSKMSSVEMEQYGSLDDPDNAKWFKQLTKLRDFLGRKMKKEKVVF